MTHGFDFEQLDVLRVATDMLVVIDAIAAHLPWGRGYIRDQLRRSANSVVLNIAEGAGELAPSEKARFYRMARRSATEAAAQVVVVERLALGGDKEVPEVRALLTRVVPMLVKMAMGAEERGRRQ